MVFKKETIPNTHRFDRRGIFDVVFDYVSGSRY